jgi:hypothetical protein
MEIFTGWRLGLGKELLDRKELITTNIDLVAGLEGRRDDPFLGLDGEVYLVDRAENFVDLANGCLVLQVDGGVEVRNLGVDRFANHLAFTSMHESAHL